MTYASAARRRAGTTMRACAALVVLMSLTACARGAGSETTSAVCDEWRGSLPTGSVSDTTETLRQIDRAYAVQDDVCSSGW